MFPIEVREDKTEEFLEKCKHCGLSKGLRQELIDHSKKIKKTESYNKPIHIETIAQLIFDVINSCEISPEAEKQLQHIIDLIDNNDYILNVFFTNNR